MLSREELLALSERYQRKADTAYQKYQATGIGRYDHEYLKNEDLSDAMLMAANTLDEHVTLMHLRSEINNLAFRADVALASGEPYEAITKILGNMILIAVVYCRYKKMEERK